MNDTNGRTAEILNKLEQIEELSTLQYKKGMEVMKRKVMSWLNDRADKECEYIKSLNEKSLFSEEKHMLVTKLQGKVEILTELFDFLNVEDKPKEDETGR